MLIGYGGKCEYHFTINGIPLKKGIVLGEVVIALGKVIIYANLLLSIILFSRVVAKCHSWLA